MTFFDRIRILPLLILVASVSLMVRLGDVLAGARGLSGTAFAQEEVKVEPPAFPATPPEAKKDPAPAEGTPAVDPKAPKAEEEKKAEHAPEEDPPEGEVKTEKEPEKNPKQDWKDATDTDLEYSDVKMELFQDLSERRKSIESREKELATREAILKAGEQELNQKFRELDTLRKEIEGLLEKQSGEEEARIGSLVKIYEAMKPKDAARIFDSLDMDVLIAVVSRMSERKTSPLMAEMNPERARAITILLAQQKQLPVLPQE